MTAPIASGWSDCRVGLAPTGKRRLCTAPAKNRHLLPFLQPYQDRLRGPSASCRAAQFATRRHQLTAFTPLPCLCHRPRTNFQRTRLERIARGHTRRLGVGSAGRNSDAKLRASPRCEARLQQIKLSDQLAGGLVGEPAGAGNTVDFGPFGTKPGQTQPPLDLIDLARQ